MESPARNVLGVEGCSGYHQRDEYMGLRFSESACNLLGGVVAMLAMILANAVFVFRLLERPRAEYIAGELLIGLIIPLLYLLVSSFRLKRPGIYLAWVGLMVLFLVVELVVDYAFQLPFRDVPWQAIAYVMLFFAALGGMIGLAGTAGKQWVIPAMVGFWVTAVMAFVQRQITGL